MGEGQTAAERGAVDCRDEDRRVAPHRLQGFPEQVRAVGVGPAGVLQLRPGLGEVHARRERLVPGSGQHDDRRLRPQLLQRVLKRVQQGLVQGIALLGPVQGHDRVPAALLDQDGAGRAAGHSGPPRNRNFGKVTSSVTSSKTTSTGRSQASSPGSAPTIVVAMSGPSSSATSAVT